MKNLLLLTVLIAGLFFTKNAHATHIIGAEVSYECLGNNDYRIILDVYRDCGPGSAFFDAFAFVQLFNHEGEYIDAPTVNITYNDSDTIPNNISNDPCLLPPDTVCVARSRYEAIRNIDEPNGFYIVYQRCCRNAGTANIVNSIETGSTYFVYVSPESIALCNNSPRFDTFPPLFVCAGIDLMHDHAATDLDGDSLVYRLYTPHVGASQADPHPLPGDASPPPYANIIWEMGYSLDNMLGPSPGGGELAIDSETGLITGHPILMGQFVVGVAVDEYRNGILMSTVFRDYQYTVGDCVDANANIEANAAQCDDLTVNFGNETQGPPNYTWYFEWPNLSPSSTEAEPTHIYPDTGKYVVALVVAPGFECVDTAFHEILLQTNSLTPDFNWQTFDCADESVLVLTDLSADAVSPIVTWNWTVEYGGTILTDTVPNPVFVVPNPSSGTITLNVISENGCDQTTMQNFVTGQNNPLDSLPGLVEICIGETAELNPDGPTVGFTYEWGFPVPSSQQILVNPMVMPIVNTTYAVTITGYNGLCQSTGGEVPVEVSEAVVLDFVEDTDCDVRDVLFVNQSANADQGYVWDFGDPASTSDTSTDSDPTYSYPSTGTYTVTLATAPDAICKDTITREIELVEKILEADFSFAYTDCEEDALAIQFFDETMNSLNNTVGWLWEFSGIYNGTSNQENPTILLMQEGSLTVTLTVTTDEDCVSTTVPQTLQIDFTELPGIDEGNPPLGCLNTGVTLNPGGNPGYIYQWSPAIGLSCTDCPSPFANPTQTTTYTVQVLNISADTCEIIRQVMVFVPENVNLLAGNDVLTCDEEVTLTATSTLAVTGLTWFHNGGQVGTGSTLDVIVSGYDDYVIMAIDQFDCPYFDTVQVVGGPADIMTSGDEIICSDELENVFAENLDSDDTLTWQWTPLSAFDGPTDVANPDVIVTPGEQMLYVEAVNQFGCSVTDSVFMAVVDIENNLDFSSQVGCSGSTVTFENMSTDAFNYFWDFGDPATTTDTSTLENPMYTYDELGTYTVTLTIGYAGLQCVTPVTHDVIITDPDFIPDFDFEFLQCEEDSILVQFHDTSVNFLMNTNSWYWTTSNGDIDTIPDPIFWVYNEDDFVVTLVIGTPNDCVDSTTQTLKLDFPVIELPDSITLCQGDSTALNPLGNTSYAYLWFPNENISDPTAINPTVWPSETTTYSVEITTFDIDTCSLLREVTIFVPERIQVEASDDTLTCGTPVELWAISNVAPTTFQWTNSGMGVVGGDPTLEIYPLFDEIYKVVGTDQYGCQDSAFVAVDNESIDVELIAPTEACPEVEIELSVTNNVIDHMLDYGWSSTPADLILPPANTATVTVNTVAAGLSANYEVIVGNQFGCADTLSQNIITYDFTSTVQDTVLACPSIATELNPGADDLLTYIWSPDDSLMTGVSSNPIVTTNETTLFDVTVSTIFGMEECSEDFEVLLIVAPVIEFEITQDTFTCGEPIEISATTNVVADLTWVNSAGDMLGTGSTLEVNPDSVETYTVIANQGFDTIECNASASVTVFNRQLDLAIDGQGVIDTCPSPNYDLCVTNLDMVDILTYQWEGDTIQSGANLSCVTVTTAVGSVTDFTVLVENQWGCQILDTVQVTTFEFNPIIREIEDICPNVPTMINEEAAGSDFMWEWTPQIGLSCYDCPNPIAILDTSVLYTVVVTGEFGADECSLTGTVQVNVMPQIFLEAEATGGINVCDDSPVTLTALISSPFVEEYIWSENPDLSDPIGTTNEITVFPNGTVTYYVSAIDTMGCADTAEITLNAFPILISHPDTLNFCEEDSTLTITLENVDPVNDSIYIWSPDEYIVEYIDGGASVVVDIEESTLFTVTVTNQFLCEETYEIFVEYFNIGITVGEISSTEDTIYFNSGEFSQLEIDFNEGYEYEWSPQDGLDDPFIYNPIAEPDETTTYTVTITDEGGCIAVREVTVVVINPDCVEPNLFLPNAFTPNGDGENDVLYFYSNIVEEMDLAIYNRWGQLIFQSTDQSVGWDGSYKGEILSPDVFGYYLKAKCFNGMEFFKKGNITILR